MPTWLYAIVLWPFVTAFLNLVLANETRERAWVSAHPRAAVVLLWLDALGVNPWRLVATLRSWWRSKRPPGAPPVLPTLAVALLAFAAACATPFRPACTAEAGAQRTTRFIADVLVACAPYKGRADWRDACAAYTPLRVAYDRDRLAWEQCR